MNEISSRQSVFERVRSWFSGRDLRGPIAFGAVGAVIVGSLTIVGVASAQNGNGFFGIHPSSSKGPLADDLPKEGATPVVPTKKPSETPKPEPTKTEAPAAPKETKAPEVKPSKSAEPVVGYIPETLDQIMAAVNSYRAGKGYPAYGVLGGNCEKIDYAWSDALPGGRISTNIITENPGPLGRTIAAPGWMASEAYWYDDGSKGGIPSVKIKIYQCTVKETASPSPSPSVTPSDPPSPTPSPSSTEGTE
jgi:hypothetical protein